jgi:DNA modification methylase
MTSGWKFSKRIICEVKMNELSVLQNNLPDNIEDLSKFVLIGREKLKAVKAEISAIQKLGLAKEVYEQKKSEAQEIAETVTLAEMRTGELLKQIPKATTNHKKLEIDSGVDFLKPQEEPPKPKAEVIKDLGFTQKQAERMQTLAENPEIVKQAIQEARNNDDIVSRSFVLGKIKQEKKKTEVEQAEKKVADEYKKQEIKPVIHVGDSFDYEPSEPYKLLLTDPPYSTDVANIDGFAKSWLPKALKNVRDDGFAYVFIGAYPEELKAYLNVETPAHIKLEQVLIWTYKNTLGNNPKDRYKLNYQACLFYRGINAPALDCPITNEQWAVQEINAPDGRIGDRYHAWQKPMEIAERFIRHSTKAGDTVFDPFACTGTFLLASAKLGRKAYGIEINPENAEIAIKRGCVYG